MNATTLVLGASLNPSRTAHQAIHKLRSADIPVIAVGRKVGKVADVPVYQQIPDEADVHTVTLYIRPDIQQSYMEELIKLKPKRIIFNPGTEHPEIYTLLKENGIEVVVACTLVLLATSSYS